MKVAIVGGTGAFGRALAKRLAEIGQDEVVVGSRDAERAQATADELGVSGGRNVDIVGDADLVVLAVKSNATLETAAELAEAIGKTPVLCVASDLRFTDAGVLPGRHQGSLAEEVARLVRAPVSSGFQSFAAANVVQGDPGDALICGEDSDAKTRALELAEHLGARGVDAGPLANSRALEGMTSVILNVNKRYKARVRHPHHWPALSNELRIIPVEGLPEIKENDDLAELVAAKVEVEAATSSSSHRRWCRRRKAASSVSTRSSLRTRRGDRRRRPDPRRIEAILREANASCACANRSSSPRRGTASSAPPRRRLVEAPERAARLAAGGSGRIGAAPARTFRELTGRDVAVLVTDSFGRPWRQGTIDVALGAAGLEVMRDLRGRLDRVGYELHATMIAVADEIASAAELVMGKVDGIPAAVVRGLGGRGRRKRPRPRHSRRTRSISLAPRTAAARAASHCRSRRGRRAAPR